jgi:alkane 1-monooxygenase
MLASTWKYFFSLLPSLFTILGNLAGGHWAKSNAIFSLIFMVLVDFVLPKNRYNQSPDFSPLPNLVLFSGFVFQMLCVSTLLFQVSTGHLTDSAITWAAISTGLNSGLLGITSAHEMIHRKSFFFKSLGIINLFSCFYSHFYIEHRKGHHAFVGTPKDPATAKKGESIYRFFLRTIPAQWSSAFQIEKERLKRVKANPFGWRNFVLNSTLVQILFCLVLYYWGGFGLLYAFLLQALIGFLLLEYVNYIEHYGLKRNPGEKVEGHHAWQSDSVTSRFTLFELSRHSHHHMDARVEYHGLNSQESHYFLPFGYYGMFYIALIPPLWFRVMDHRLSAS